MTGWRDRVNEAQGQQTGGSWRDRVRLGVPSTTPTVQSPEAFRDWLWNVQLSNAAHYPEIAEQNYIPVEPERTLSEQEQEYLSLLRERGTLPERAINRYDLQTWVAGFNPETGEVPLPAPIVPGPDPLMQSYRRVTGNLMEPIRGLGYLVSGVAVGLNALYNLARPERFNFEGTDLSRRISPPAFQEDWVDRATNLEMLHPDLVAPLTAAWNSVFGGANGINTLAGHPEWNVGPGLQMIDAAIGRPYTAASESYGRMVNPVAQFAGEMTAMTVIDPLMWIPGAGGFIPALKSSRLLLMMEEGPRLIKYAADLRNVSRYLESTRLLTSELSAVRAVGMPIGEGRNVVEAWIRGLETQGIRTPTIGEFIGWGFNQGNARVRKVLDPYGPLRRIYLAAYRMGGAQGVQDVVNMGEFRNMIRRIAVESGMTEAEVNAEAVRQIEEIWAAEHQGIREMGTPTRFNAREEVIPPQPLVTEMTPEQRAAIELNRTRDANVLIPRRGPTGEIVQEVWPEVPEGWSTPLARERVQTAPGTPGPREEVWPEVPEGWSAPLRMEDVEIPRLPTEPTTTTPTAGAGGEGVFAGPSPTTAPRTQISPEAWQEHRTNIEEQIRMAEQRIEQLRERPLTPSGRPKKQTTDSINYERRRIDDWQIDINRGDEVNLKPDYTEPPGTELLSRTQQTQSVSWDADRYYEYRIRPITEDDILTLQTRFGHENYARLSEIHGAEFVIERRNIFVRNNRHFVKEDWSVVHYDRYREGLIKKALREDEEFLDAVSLSPVHQRLADEVIQEQMAKNFPHGYIDPDSPLPTDLSDIGDEIRQVEDQIKILKDEIDRFERNTSPSPREIYANELAEQRYQASKARFKRLNELNDSTVIDKSRDASQAYDRMEKSVKKWIETSVEDLKALNGNFTNGLLITPDAIVGTNGRMLYVKIGPTGAKQYSIYNPVRGRILDTPYPDWEQVIPKEFLSYVDFDDSATVYAAIKELNRRLKAIGKDIKYLTGKKGASSDLFNMDREMVILEIREGGITVRWGYVGEKYSGKLSTDMRLKSVKGLDVQRVTLGPKTDIGTIETFTVEPFEVFIPCNVQGSGAVAVNRIYLENILSGGRGRIRLGFGGTLDPMLASLNDSKYSVLMPVRMPEGQEGFGLLSEMAGKAPYTRGQLFGELDEFLNKPRVEPVQIPEVRIPEPEAPPSLPVEGMPEAPPPVSPTMERRIAPGAPAGYRDIRPQMVETPGTAPTYQESLRPGAPTGYQDIRPRMETRRAPGFEEPEFGWTQEAGMQQGIFGPEEPPRLPAGEEPPIIRPLSRSETGEYVTGYREPVRQIGEISSTEPYVPNVTEPPVDSGGKYNYWRRYTPPGAPTAEKYNMREAVRELIENQGFENREIIHMGEESYWELLNDVQPYDPRDLADINEGRKAAGLPRLRNPKLYTETAEGEQIPLTGNKLRNEYIRYLTQEGDFTTEIMTAEGGEKTVWNYWGVREAVDDLENPHLYGRGTSGEVREGIEQMHLFGQEAGPRLMEYQIAGTVEARKAIGMQPRTSQIREEFRRVVELRQNIGNLYTELERRGRGIPRMDLDHSTVPDLEREWRNVREIFSAAQAERMAGVRYFQRTVKAQAGVPRHIYENTNFDSLLREATIGLRDADPETVYNYAKILYEGASDALNVGPRAPLMRERAAEMLIAPLEGHWGYLKHITDPDLEDKWLQAAIRGRERPQMAFGRPRGAPPTRRATSGELERQIFHGSTRTRAFRGSITEANKLAAEGRVWIEPATKVGEIPEIHFLVEGELPGAGWIRVNKVFDTDLVRIVAARRLSASRALAGKQYLDEVMTRFGTYSPEGIPKEGGYSIFDLSDMSTRPHGGGESKPTQRWNETFGRFSEQYQEKIKHTYFEDSGTARAVCRYVDISNGDAIVQDLLAIERQGWGMIKQLNTYWKAKQLYPFTSYWLRNYYDDVVRAFTWFEHLHVGDFGEAFSLIYHGKVPNRVKTWMAGQLGIDESEVTLEMVLMKMREQGIFDSGIMFDEVDGQVLRGAGRPDRVSDIAMAEMSGTNWRQRVKMGWRGNEPGMSPWNSIWNPASTNFVVDQVGKQLGMDGNNTIRLSAAFAGMREEGMTLELLGDKVRRVMIDYLDVDPFTATLRKTGLSPFITFTRQSIPLNVRALFERGGRVALRLRAFDTIDRMNRERYGDQPQPAWMDAKVYMFGRNIWFKPQNFDSAFDLGELLHGIENYLGGDKASLDQIISKYGNPFVNEIISQLYNLDLFTGRAVYEESTSRNVPMFFQALGYEEEYTRFSHAMGDVWRAVREMQQLYKAARRENGLDTSYLLRKVGGLPFYNAEPGQTVYFGLKDNTVLLENIGAANTYGNWNFYNVTPNRIDRAATLLWERLALNYADQGFFQDDPYTGEPRPATGDYNSQDELVERMQADIKGMFLLNDRWNEVSEENRTRVGQVAPFTVQELEFLGNLYQSLLLTQIALTMKAVRLGELTEEQAEQRIMREYEQLATVTP